MHRITLFELENDSIKISMELYFTEKGQLIFDGYDIGRNVKEFWGDSDYEYTYTIEPEAVEKLYTVLKVSPGDQWALLEEIKKRFGGNSAYSAFGRFMDENDIKYKGFTWT